MVRSEVFMNGTRALIYEACHGRQGRSVHWQQPSPEPRAQSPVLLALENKHVLFRSPRSTVFAHQPNGPEIAICELLRSPAVHKTQPRCLTARFLWHPRPHPSRESKAIPMFLYLQAPTMPMGRPQGMQESRVPHLGPVH